MNHPLIDSPAMLCKSAAYNLLHGSALFAREKQFAAPRNNRKRESLALASSEFSLLFINSYIEITYLYLLKLHLLQFLVTILVCIALIMWFILLLVLQLLLVPQRMHSCNSLVVCDDWEIFVQVKPQLNRRSLKLT